MKIGRIHIVFVLLMMLVATVGHAQQTVFALLKGDEERADELFKNRNFKDASKYYAIALQRKKASNDIYLKLGRTNFFLQNYQGAIHNFDLCKTNKRSLAKEDVLIMGEAYTSLGQYSKAIEVFRQYLSVHGNDALIMKKVWRLTNAEFLYEDSLHYTVTPLVVNTGAAELCATPFRDGILFLSNRKQLRVIEKLNASEEPFLKLYYAQMFADSVINGKPRYDKVSKPQAGLLATFNVGPFAVYDKDTKIVYAHNQRNNDRTLGLSFAEFQNGQWLQTSTFDYNAHNFSITDPWISNDGMILYFSSDMPGGYGGKDIYRSNFVNGKWSKPVNMGDVINTSLDEVFPYFHNHVLYFSSNGHAGLGGLDLFRADLLTNEWDEPKNMGYPLNSTYDDFSIRIDSLSKGGYFSSNRVGKGFNDDIFEFEMDLQTYPVEISGHLRFKEHFADDTSHIQVLAHAKMYLIDATRNVTVFECASDVNGQFSLVIPYFSKYKIKVIGLDQHENMVSLEIPKHRKDYSTHDIVVVQDAFKQTDRK